jgi:anti-sigma factor RsiW
MGNPRCKWVRDRLPLLASDDLQGLDRRRVERHLIGCPPCREQQTALSQVLTTLRTAAATSPNRPDAPSLWPALARQIRESRRPVPAPLFTFPFAVTWHRLAFRPALGLGLGLLATIVVSLAVRKEVADARAHIAASELPIATHRPRPPEPPAPSPRREVPGSIETPVVENPPVYDYILDYGRPMPPDVRESRDTMATY